MAWYYKVIFTCVLITGSDSIIGNLKEESLKVHARQERYIHYFLIAGFFGYNFVYKLIIPYFYHQFVKKIEINSYWPYLTKSYEALSNMRENYRGVVQECLIEGQGNFITKILQKTINDFTTQLVDPYITTLHVIEDAKEDEREARWDTLPFEEKYDYTLVYDPDIPGSILHYVKVLFNAFELNVLYNTLYLVHGSQGRGAAMSAVFNKKERWCGIYLSSRVIERFNLANNCMELVDKLIHEMCHIKHQDPSASTVMYAQARAGEFRAECWVPERYPLCARLRFFGTIEAILFSSSLSGSLLAVQHHSAYPSLLEKYIIARTLYRYTLKNPNDFSEMLYDMSPQLLRLDGKLMSLYQKNKEKMLLVPQLLENMRNQQCKNSIDFS